MSSAIPTMYAGVQFRSRLEAKWAAFFDRLSWPWEYEPIDLNGYIPDFILTFAAGPLLVEVKPSLVLDDLHHHTAKIDTSGWSEHALVVGARIFPGEDVEGVVFGPARAGLYKTVQGRSGARFYPGIWNPITTGSCSTCHHSLVSGETGRCLSCGQWDTVSYFGDEPALLKAFTDAGNATQWKPPRRKDKDHAACRASFVELTDRLDRRRNETPRVSAAEAQDIMRRLFRGDSVR